jgi:hypothetical protein
MKTCRQAHRLFAVRALRHSNATWFLMEVVVTAFPSCFGHLWRLPWERSRNICWYLVGGSIVGWRLVHAKATLLPPALVVYITCMIELVGPPDGVCEMVGHAQVAVLVAIWATYSRTVREALMICSCASSAVVCVTACPSQSRHLDRACFVRDARLDGHRWP